MRKLATAAIALSAAVFASHYLLPPDYFLLCAAVCVVVSLPALFLKNDMRRRALLITLSAAVGFSVSYISYTYKTVPAREISGSEQSITARVTDYPEIHDEYAAVSLRLTGDDDDVPKLGAVLYSFEGGLTELKPGDIIKADVSLKAADERYGEAFSGNNSDNVYLLCYLNGNIEISGKSAFSFLYFPKTIAKNIKESVGRVFFADTVPFITALLTGDKTSLYEDTSLYASMSEAGILHVVAVSGMHVAFLVGFIMMIVRRKRFASLIAIPIIWLFVPVAGASPSVIRAAFMQSTVLVAPVFHRENDGITSLTAVLAVLLLINPNACASISLQLSFTAMLGIILVTPKIYKSLLLKVHPKSNESIWRRAKIKLLMGSCAVFSASIGAMVFTTPIAALYFGYVSIIGILVNILVLWAVSAGFILGYVSCFLGLVWLPLGTALGALTSIPLRYIIFVVKLSASVPYAAVYTDGNFFGSWLVLVYIIFIICYVFKRKEGFRPVIPVCLAVFSLCCIILAAELRADNDTGTLTAVDVGQGQSIILTSGGATAVIDCGGKGENENAGDMVAGLLLGNGRQTVDILALTHFDEDHINGVSRLMSRVSVKRLVIPDGSYDKAGRDEILNIAREMDTQVYIIQDDAMIKAGDLEIYVYPTISPQEQSLMFLGCIGDFEAFISGDAYSSEEQRFLMTHTLPDTELFVAGHHGSKYSSCEELLTALNAEYVVVSCGYNTYGHPTKEALERFAAADMEIFRTDQSGNITVSIGG